MYDDSDPADDVYKVDFCYTVPANTTGAYLQIYWNGDISTAHTCAVETEKSGVVFAWKVGEFGNGDHDSGYYFTVNLCDEDDNIMATDGGHGIAFIRG